MPSGYREVTDEEFEQIVEYYRQGMAHLSIAKLTGCSRGMLSRYYRFGRPGTKKHNAREPIYLTIQREKEMARAVLSGVPISEEKPNDTIMKMIEEGVFNERVRPGYDIYEEQATYNAANATASPSVESHVLPDDEIPRNLHVAPPLWNRSGGDIKLDAKSVKEAIKDEKEAIVKEISDSMRDAIISQTTETISAVEDRLDSIRYARAVKGMLAQQAPMVKKAINVIGQIVDDLGQELPSLSTMQKVSVLQRVSGYIGAWQGSVEAAIRLERLLLGEPESHVAVSEMTQEDALKKLDRLRALAEQAKSRVVSDS